jgi:hypothetical protein
VYFRELLVFLRSRQSASLSSGCPAHSFQYLSRALFGEVCLVLAEVSISKNVSIAFGGLSLRHASACSGGVTRRQLTALSGARVDWAAAVDVAVRLCKADWCVFCAAATASADSPSYVSTSTKYAIVEVAGQQIIVEEGRWYSCNRLEVCTFPKRAALEIR